MTETVEILRSRLRTAAFILCVGFTVFLIVYIDPTLDNRFLMGLHIATAVLMGLCTYALSERFGWRLHQLRAFEYVVFGLPAVYFVWLQMEWIALVVDFTRESQSPSLLAGLSGRLLLPWICIMFIYGSFIPNTWQRCAAHVLPLALIPAAGFIHACLAVPEGTQLLRGRLLLEMLLWGSVPAFTSILAAHTLNALRKKAVIARELGAYHLKQKLGEGGMGEVYLGEHKLLKRPCAIKLIRTSQATDPKAIARFESEVQATARLTHWNTIEIFDYGHTEDGTFYYAMEYLPGMNLQDLVDRFGPMPPERAVHLLRQICDGLREAHAMGLIHRDIKPGNIFATTRGGIWDVAKLVDFGLVKSLASVENKNHSADGLVVGTPLFASPEWTLNDGRLDARSDIYSLGAVGYFLVTGRPVFNHPSPLKVLFAHANESVIPIRDSHPNVSEDFESLIMRCLAKKPDDRFATVTELGRALDRCRHAGQWTQDEAAIWWSNIDLASVMPGNQQPSDPAAITQLLETSSV